MISEGKTYAESGRIVGCSNKMIHNALLFVEKDETRGRKPSMSNVEIKRLVRQSKKEPFKPATELKKELQIAASVETVRKRLRQNHLIACSPRKVPLLTVKHVAMYTRTRLRRSGATFCGQMRAKLCCLVGKALGLMFGVHHKLNIILASPLRR